MPCYRRRLVGPYPAKLPRLLMNVRPLLTLGLLLCCCQPSGGSATRFCDRSAYVPFVRRMLNKDYFEIDTVHRIFRSDDYGENIRLINTSAYFGMYEPMPIIIPRLASISQGALPRRVESGKFLLIFIASPSSRGLFIGKMYDKTQKINSPILVYRYGKERGVYRIDRIERRNGVSYGQTFVRCGGAKLLSQ